MAKLTKYLEENILSLGVISLLLFIPLYPKFPLFNLPGTYVAVRLEDFWLLAVFLLWLGLEIKQGFPSFKEKTARLVLVYFLAGFLSLVFALTVTKIVTPHLAILHYLRRVEYLACFFIAFAAIKKKRHLKSFVYVLLISATGTFVFGIGQKYFNWPVISTMNEEFSKGLVLYLSEWTRISATFAGHYDLAAFSVLAFCLFLGFILGVKKKLLKLMAILISAGIFYLLLLTASRISFGAYLLAGFLILIFSQKKWLTLPFLAVSLGAMLLSADLGQRYLATFRHDFSFLTNQFRSVKKEIAMAPIATPTLKPTPPPTGEKEVLVPPAPGETRVIREKKGIATMSANFPEPEPVEMAIQRSGQIRFQVEWPRAIRAFLKNPLLGTGYSSVTLATDNDYLRALAETGLMGFGALAWLFLEIGTAFLLFIKEVKNSFERNLVIGIGGGMLGFLANAAFIDVFEASKVAIVFWLLAGMMMATISKRKSIK